MPKRGAPPFTRVMSQILPGKVVSYGELAAMAGLRPRRALGWPPDVAAAG